MHYPLDWIYIVYIFNYISLVNVLKPHVEQTKLVSLLACFSGELLNESSGFFSSPNFPNNYTQYSRCTWNITVPSGYIIKVSFLHFELGDRWRGGAAQLTITNVPTGVITLAGDSLPDPVYSVGNSMQVIFASLNRQYSGFNASYTAITFESGK